MPDCSAVEIHATIDDDLDGYAIAALTALIESAFFDTEPNGFDNYVTDATAAHQLGRITVEDYDAAWGMSAASGTMNLLDRLGVPYSVFDGGHYTWSPLARMSAPGMPDEYRRVICTTVDGVPVFTIDEINECGAEWARAIAQLDPTMFIDYDNIETNTNANSGSES